MFFKLTPTTGQPLYLQLMQQIRHAVETGALRDGEQLPGIRTLAEELVISPNTVAKAYSELEHEGLLEMRHGSGAFVCVKRRTRSLADQVQIARRRLRDLTKRLREDGLWMQRSLTSSQIGGRRFQKNGILKGVHPPLLFLSTP